MEVNRSKMEQLISATRSLVDKIQGNERVVSGLMKQCETLQEALRGIKEYQGSLQALGQFSGNKRQLVEIEGAYVQQLQVENVELRALLEEHQSALEMIMSKYRSQVQGLMSAQHCDRSSDDVLLREELEQKSIQLHSVAQNIQRALDMEENETYCTQRRLAQLEFENKNLRELLMLASEASVTTPANPMNQNAVVRAKTDDVPAPKSPILQSPLENDHSNPPFYRTLYDGPHQVEHSQGTSHRTATITGSSFNPDITLPLDDGVRDSELTDSFSSGTSTPKEGTSGGPVNRTDEFVYR